MQGDVVYLVTALGGLLILVGVGRAVVKFLLGAALPIASAEETEGKPFSPEEYEKNKADGKDWDLQQAMRRAGRLAHQGRKAEAIATLRAVLAEVTDPRARGVLEMEIERLGAEPTPAPSPAARPATPKTVAPDDPYADRME